jgi:hypothetical protein
MIKMDVWKNGKLLTTLSFPTLAEAESYGAGLSTTKNYGFAIKAKV